MNKLFRRKPKPAKPKAKKVLRKPDGTIAKGSGPLNPTGRPTIPKEGRNLAEKFRKAMSEPIEEGNLYTRLDRMIDEAVTLAQAGHYQFFEYVLARGFGKIPDRVQIETDPEWDLSVYTDEELALLETLKSKQLEKDVTE
jgi:hypothetical protein